MAAGARGWLVILHLRSGSREWTVSGSRINKLKAFFFDCLSPVSLHLLKVPQPCQIAPPPGNHVCKHTSLCGAFSIQTTTDRCCVDSNESTQHKDWISLELLKCLSDIRSRLLILLAEEQNRVGCDQWTICSVDRSQNWDSPYRHSWLICPGHCGATSHINLGELESPVALGGRCPCKTHFLMMEDWGLRWVPGYQQLLLGKIWWPNLKLDFWIQFFLWARQSLQYHWLKMFVTQVRWFVWP